MQILRGLAVSLIFAATSVLAPSLCLANEEPPSIIKYGFEGFWTGAQVGLASGYLATGQDYESGEWRKLVFGAGVGALVGVGAGITLGIVDVGQPAPRTGWLVLRDTGYGLGLGAIVGTAVGALFVIDSGDPKDLLVGASIGTLVGAGAGIAFGLIEGAAADRPPSADGTATALRFTLVGAEGSWLPMPGLRGNF